MTSHCEWFSGTVRADNLEKLFERGAMKMKKLFALILSVVMVLSLAACSGGTTATPAASAKPSTAPTAAGGKVIKVGFAQVGHESDWRTASTKSVQTALSKENGFDLRFVDCDNNSATQLEAVRSFIQQQVDYIVIDPIVSTGWDTVLTEAQNAKIPVVVMDRTIDDSTKYVTWIGSEFTNEGLAAGAWLKDYAKAKSITGLNVLVIKGTTGSSAEIGRTKGFEKIAKENGWTILDQQDGGFTQAGGQTVMESYCKSYAGKFNVVVCQNDNEAFGAMDAMNAAGVTYGVNGKVILISFDACKAALKLVLAGKINADFQCNPLQGPTLSDTIKKLAAGQTVAPKTYMPEPWFVSENTLKNITYTNNAGKTVTEDLVQVTQAIADASY